MTLQNQSLQQTLNQNPVLMLQQNLAQSPLYSVSTSGELIQKMPSFYKKGAKFREMGMRAADSVIDYWKKHLL